MGATIARVYKRFAQSIDAVPRVTARGHAIDTDHAPTNERYRRPIGAGAREDADNREAWQDRRMR